MEIKQFDGVNIEYLDERDVKMDVCCIYLGKDILTEGNILVIKSGQVEIMEIETNKIISVEHRDAPYKEITLEKSKCQSEDFIEKIILLNKYTNNTHTNIVPIANYWTLEKLIDITEREDVKGIWHFDLYKIMNDKGIDYKVLDLFENNPQILKEVFRNVREDINMEDLVVFLNKQVKPNRMSNQESNYIYRLTDILEYTTDFELYPRKQVKPKLMKAFSENLGRCFKEDANFLVNEIFPYILKEEDFDKKLEMAERVKEYIVLEHDLDAIPVFFDKPFQELVEYNKKYNAVALKYGSYVRDEYSTGKYVFDGTYAEVLEKYDEILTELKKGEEKVNQTRVDSNIFK